MALKSRLELEVDGRSAEQQVNDIRAALEALEQAGVRASSTLRKSGGDYSNLAMSLAKVQAANDKAVSSNEAATKSADAAAKASANHRKELDSLLGKIDPLTKKLNDLAAQEAALAKARDSGQINSATFDAYSRKLQDSLNSLAGVSNAQKVVGETAEQARVRILAVAEASVKAAQEQRNLANVATGLSEAEQGLLSGNMVLAANQGRLAESTQKVAAANRKAEVATEAQTESLNDLLAAIDPTTRALNRLDEQERKLAQQKKIGALDADTFDHYQGKIDQARSALTGFNDGLNRTGNTAKQNAAALRMLPAQFSDIFISLQGGQAPLTVFLQQGSQIKDSFGGIGAAAKAMGGYIYGLINPLTVAAASGVALAAVFVNAEREASALNKALFSGSASSGQTAEGLSQVAKEVASITGRLSAARDVVVALAASTGLSESQFRNLAGAAGSISEFTGKGASEVASSLGDLGDSATKAAQKISAQYGLLTSAQYDVIKGLEDQGRKQEALDLLSETLNKNAQERLKRYRASLSDIERDWNDIGTAISNAYSKVRGELFPDTAKEIEIIERILKTRRDGGIAGALSNGLSSLHGALGLRSEGNDDSTPALEKRLALLKSTVSINEQNAAAEGKSTRENQARIKAEAEWAALVKSNYSSEKKLAEDIANARKLGVEAGKSQVEIDKEIADIQAKYDKAQAKPKAFKEDAGQRLLNEAREREAVLIQQNSLISSQGVVTERLGAQAQALIKWEQQLADIKSKKTLTADQKSLIASQDLITAQLKRNAELEKQADISKGILQAQKDQVQLLTLTGQLREANSMKSSLDDAALMAEYERQGNVEALKRLETLIKIRDVNLKTGQQPGTIEGVSSAPGVTGIDVAVGGAYSEIERLNAQQVELDAWRASELEKQQAYLDLKAVNEKTYADRVENIDKQAQLGREKIEKAKNIAILSASEDFFGNMATLSQSGNSRLGAIGKAAAIAQATISTYKSATDSYAALAAIPIVGPALGFAAAGAAIAAGLANVASISGVGFSQGGYTGSGGVNDPAGVVHKGEVVWSQADIRRFGGVSAVEALRTGSVTPITASKGSAGYLGQTGTQGSGLQQTININNFSSAQVEQRRMPNGDLEVVITEATNRAVQEIAGQISNGYGNVVDAGEGAYGWKRTPY